MLGVTGSSISGAIVGGVVWSSGGHYYHPHPCCHNHGPIYEAVQNEVSWCLTSILASSDLGNHILEEALSIFYEFHSILVLAT